MRKYIDAEKLITEIERLQQLNECYKRNWRWKFKWFSRTVTGRMEVLEGIKIFINSLQQEQSIDTDILHDKLVDFLVRNDISEKKANFLANRIADVYGSQRYIDGLCDGLKQEQPNIDLEEEVKKYFEGYWPGMKTPEACNHQMVFTTPAIMRMIEHFYKLGINTRK